MSIQIISPPANITIPNPYIINGVAHFVQNTKPTTRIVQGVLSPLVVGDKWYDTASNIDYFWNGTYWLSSILFQKTSASTSQSANLYTFSSVTALQNWFDVIEQSFYLVDLIILLRITGVFDEVNNWSFSGYISIREPNWRSYSTNTISPRINAGELDNGANAVFWKKYNLTYNTPVIYPNSNTFSMYDGIQALTRTGNPASLTIAKTTTRYRLIAP